MNPDAKETLAACVANLTACTTVLRSLAGPDFAPSQKEIEGLLVMTTELDTIVEGLWRVVTPSEAEKSE